MSIRTSKVLGFGLALCLTVSCVGAVDDVESDQESAALAGRLDGIYTLKSASSGKCLDVKDRSRGNGAAIQQWDCSSQSNQIWKITSVGEQYRIESVHSGKCLDVRAHSTQNGAAIEQWECADGQSNQLWRLVASGSGFNLVSLGSGKCLDVSGWSSANGGLMQQWACGTGQANQQWRLTAVSPLPAAAETLAKLRLVNDNWIRGHADSGDNAWARSVYFIGDMAAVDVTGEQRYLDYAANWAKKHQFSLRGGATGSFADDQVAGQVYAELYRRNADPQRLTALRQQLRGMVEKPGASEWWWVDALFMGMPAFTKLGVIDKDGRYFDELYALYNHTKRAEAGRGLYSADGLWWRDRDYLPPYREPNGKNCYWARGNGWAFAAHARTLEELPRTDAHRAEYEDTFSTMAAAIARRQRSDGFWNASLDDPRHFGGPEASSTALFVYGYAWGMRRGLLDRTTYAPIVAKAWNALCADTLHADGFLGWVQGVGKDPSSSQPVSATSTADFGVGAFLLAAAELTRLSPP